MSQPAPEDRLAAIAAELARAMQETQGELARIAERLEDLGDAQDADAAWDEPPGESIPLDM